MATFTYTARAFNGDLRTATIDAALRDDVIAQLRKQRLSVVKIDQDAAKKIGRGSSYRRGSARRLSSAVVRTESGLLRPPLQKLGVLLSPGGVGRVFRAIGFAAAPRVSSPFYFLPIAASAACLC